MQAQVVKVKGITIELGDKTYVVPPLSLGALEQLLERIKGFQNSPGLATADVAVVVDAALAALRRNYPELTREELSDAIGLESMNEIMEAVMDVSGLKRKSLEKAEAAGKGEA